MPILRDVSWAMLALVVAVAAACSSNTVPSSRGRKSGSLTRLKSVPLPKGDYAYLDASKEYPPEARALGIEGTIRVRLSVDEHGKVRRCVPLNRLGYGLDELVLRRAASIEFEPARDADDQPVSSIVVWTFHLRLPRAPGISSGR